MKRLLLPKLVLALILLVATACSSDSDNNNQTTVPENTWKVGANAYVSNETSRVEAASFCLLSAFVTLPSATEPRVDQITFAFKSLPTNGMYKIVMKPDWETLNTDEVYVSTIEKTGDKLAACKSEGKTLTVTVNSEGDISINMPLNGAMYGTLGGALTDNTTVIANLTGF